MKTLYKSYLNALSVFAQEKLDEAGSYQEMTSFALDVHERAELLLKRASLNNLIHLVSLRKEMHEVGRKYVRKFSLKFGTRNAIVGYNATRSK